MNEDLRVARSRQQESTGLPPFHEWQSPDGTLWAEFYRLRDSYLLRFPKLADFEVAADGVTAGCWPAPGVSEATIRHLYLNQVLPLMLSRQGKLVFHASAVALAAGAVAFLGETGRGKSTLAASFAANGQPFLTDDGLVLEPTGTGYLALPSHASIRLWEDSRSALLDPGLAAAPPVSYTTKARLLAETRLPHCDRPVPLAAACFLGEGDAGDIVLTPLHGAAVLAEWVRHAFVLDIEDRAALAVHFDAAAKIARAVPCYRLDYPRSYAILDSVRRTIAAALPVR